MESDLSLGHTGQDSAKGSTKTLHSLKGWWTQAGALLVSFNLLAVIISLLMKYNHELQPQWKYSINLNTAAAALSTIIRACLVSVVDEAVISQLKWYRHRQPPPLQHISYFDSASRGVWGAVLFPFRIRSLSFAQIECFLTVASFAIGPFTQQAIRSVPCSRPAPDMCPFLPVASNIMRSREIITDEATGFSIDAPSKGAILSAMVNPPWNQSVHLLGDCGTGNCTFPEADGITHSTLGMCTKCVDTTSLLRRLNEVYADNTVLLTVGLQDIGLLVQPFFDQGQASAFFYSLDWMLHMADDGFKETVSNSIANWSVVTSSLKGCQVESTDPDVKYPYH
ncbi:hypothetical protein EJ06DRAFT_484089 [Trichodelitschia bisporula]|uniref:Uncharacterized protein n=1 Tax=Trichodelitschia bisporula TaxID=703511 RepID=A0A6G1HJV2_9PEZI|nr:hypothetical protein EJ06DRAFT_484089 [Trichodelitschia bisporula]